MWRWADGSEMESSQKPPNSFRLTALRRRLNVLYAKGKLMSTPHIAHVTIEIEYPGESCPDNSTDLIF